MTTPSAAAAPEAGEAKAISYSLWALLRQCPLKAAYSRDPEFRGLLRGGVRSAVGIARHRLVEEVHRGLKAGLGPPSVDWVRIRFSALLEEERETLAEQWGPATVPPVRRWGYVQYQAATLVRDLSSDAGSDWAESDKWANDNDMGLGNRVAGSQILQPSHGATIPGIEGEVMVEVWLEDAAHRMVGRIDHLERRHGRLIIRDLKSSVGLPREALVERHRAQMLFYAGLVEANARSWPILELLGPAGESVPVDYEPAEVHSLRSEVNIALDNLNAASVSNPATARPSLENCSWCPFLIVCPHSAGLWRDRLPASEFGRGVSLARGTVVEVSSYGGGTDVVIVQPEELTLPRGRVTVTRLPSGLCADEGDVLTVANAFTTGDSPMLRVDWGCRFHIDPKPAQAEALVREAR